MAYAAYDNPEASDSSDDTVDQTLVSTWPLPAVHIGNSGPSFVVLGLPHRRFRIANAMDSNHATQLLFLLIPGY